MYSLKEKWSFSFSSFPLSKIKYQFWILVPRQWIHQIEVKRHLQILVIKSYPEATKPTSPSKILHHPHKPHPPHTPIFPIFTQYPEELGSRGEKTKPCACTVRLLLYLAELWKRRQKSQGQMQGKGCALGSSAGCSHVPQQSRCDSRAACARGAMNPWAFWRTKQGQGTAAGGRMIVQSNLLPCHAAVCTFQLIKPKDWGEFHKLNP